MKNDFGTVYKLIEKNLEAFPLWRFDILQQSSILDNWSYSYFLNDLIMDKSHNMGSFEIKISEDELHSWNLKIIHHTTYNRSIEITTRSFSIVNAKSNIDLGMNQLRIVLYRHSMGQNS